MITTEVSDVLGNILREGVDVHRCAAAQALRRLPVHLSGDALQAALLDDDPDVRFDAAVSLGVLADPAYAPALMENLAGDPEGAIKKSVIESLCAMKYHPVAPLLRQLAVSRAEDAGIVWDADAFFEDGWDDWLDVQLAAIRGLGDLPDKEAGDAILAALDAQDEQDVSETAIPALISIGAAGAAALEGRYGAWPVRLRRRVAQALAKARGPLFDALKIMCLNDADPDVRGRAMSAVFAGSPGDPLLDPLLADADKTVRAQAVRLLGPDRPAAVRTALGDSSAMVRKAAFGAIAQNPDAFLSSDVTERLEAAFADYVDISIEAANAWVALDAEEALELLGAAANGANLPMAFRTGLLDSLKRIGTDAIPYLRLGAGDPERQLRFGALAVLGELAREAADCAENPALSVLLEAWRGARVPRIPEETADFNLPDDRDDPAPDGDTAHPGDEATSDAPPAGDPSASTLDAILTPAAPVDAPADAPFVADLDAEDTRRLKMVEYRKLGKKRVSLEPDTPALVEVRRFTASLLGEVNDPRAVGGLLDVLADADAPLVNGALEALSRLAALGAEMPVDLLVPTVLARLENGPEDARSVATRLGGYLDSDEMRAGLIARLADAPRLIRLETVRALENHAARGHAVSAALSASLADEWPAVRLAAVRILAAEEGAGALDRLIEMALYEEGYHHREIAEILAGIAPVPAMARFLEVLADDNQKRVWQVAIEAIEEILTVYQPGQTPLRQVA